MKIFFYIAALTLALSCKKPGEPLRGSGGSTGTGGGNTNNNKPPVANAGPDQTIIILTFYSGTASLNGSASYDSSGMSMQFSWRQIAGPSNSSLPNPGQKECFVDNINTPGVYSFELKVWNSNGADLDTIDITVSMPSFCQSNRPEVPVSLTFLSDLPGQIQDPEIIAVGNKLIIPAWFNNATGIISNNIYMYDRITQNWTTIQASQARIGAATIAVGNKVFFAGGIDANYTATSVVDIYDITTNTWSVSNLSEARADCKAVVSGDKIFFAGGLKDTELSNKVDIYSLETNSWTSAILPGGARVVGAAVTALDKVLFCGGYTNYEDLLGWGNTPTPTTSIDIYDNHSGQWSADTMLVNKGRFAAISVNEKIYFAGGLVNNAPSWHVEELNMNTMNSSSSCLHQPRASEKGAVVKNNMVLFFINTIYSGIVRNEFDVYNTQTGLWSIGVLPPELIHEGSFSAIVSVNNEVYTVIGTKLYKMNL